MSVALLLAAVTLVNPGFEDPGDAPTGWRLDLGATEAAQGPESEVAIDRTVARSGAASMRLRGEPGTLRWRLPAQDFAVRPGTRVVFRVAARSREVRQAGHRFYNANAVLLMFDAQGRRVGFATSHLLRDDCEWHDLVVSMFVPDGAVRATVGVFLSVPGTAWFDDARVEVWPLVGDERAAREGALLLLREHVLRTWPFFGLPGKPADGEALVADPDRPFREGLAGVLAPLADAHVWVRPPVGPVFGFLPPGDGPAPPDLRAVRERLDEVVADGPGVLAGRLGDVAYVYVGSFLAERFHGIPEELEGRRAFVIDVRGNTGGDERLARGIAARFADGPVIYARNRVRDPCRPDDLGAFLPATSRVVEPDRRLEGRAIVLQDRACMSSCEGFLLMARALERMTTVGEPSRGASGNPQPIEVLPGWVVHVSTWQSLPPDGDGACIEGRGVPPEVPFSGPGVLEKALAMLGGA